MAQLNYRQSAVPGQAGGRFDTTGFVKSLINKDPQAVQISALVVGSATNSKLYTFTVDGVSVNYTSDGTASVAEIADGLAAAASAERKINGRVTFSSDGIDTITMTGTTPGLAFVLAESDAQLSTSTTQAAAAAAAVSFGLGVISGGTNTGTGVERLGKLAKAASLTAQVDTLTLTYDAAVLALVDVKVYDPADGQVKTFKVEHTMATDAATSVTAIAALLNAILPANTVIASAATADLVLTAEVAGTPFETGFGFGTGRDTGVFVFTTNKTIATDIDKALEGVTVLVSNRERADGASASAYQPNDIMNVLENGRMYVATEASAASADGVYIRLVANGTLDALGGFSGAAGTGLYKLKNYSWHQVHSATLAVIQQNQR